MHSRQIIYLIIALMIAVFFFTGCRKEKNEQPEMTSEKTDSPEKQTSLFTIRYRPVWTAQAEFAGVYMAQKKGFYQDKGLNVII